MHCKVGQSGVQYLHPKKAGALISLDTAVRPFSVCLGCIPGIPGRLRTGLLTFCLCSEREGGHQEPIDSEHHLG